MLNLSSLFYTTDDHRISLLKNLDLAPSQVVEINKAKTAIRQQLRDALPAYFASKGHESVQTPRFFTQGSSSYGTLNAPAHPTQQADIDDGCYLPLSFLQSSKRPSLASSLFFEAAEESLQGLVSTNNWKLNSSKPTCIRVEISQYAHLDLPLYAIPDEEFARLSKAMESFDSALNREESLKQDRWGALPEDEVMLAHRENNWMISDPRPVKDWFNGNVQAKGIQLKRVVRYLKAFRDWQWENGGPASILLMTAAVSVFEKRDRRDDLALLDVISKIPSMLRKGVNHPCDENESLTERLGAEGVEAASKVFERFESHLRGAIYSNSPEQACLWLIEMMGSRFPYEPERIESATLESTIKAAPAAVAASEVIGRTKAG